MSNHYCCKKCGLRYDDCRCKVPAAKRMAHYMNGKEFYNLCNKEHACAAGLSFVERWAYERGNRLDKLPAADFFVYCKEKMTADEIRDRIDFCPSGYVRWAFVNLLEWHSEDVNYILEQISAYYDISPVLRTELKGYYGMEGLRVIHCLEGHINVVRSYHILADCLVRAFS